MVEPPKNLTLGRTTNKIWDCQLYGIIALCDYFFLYRGIICDTKSTATHLEQRSFCLLLVLVSCSTFLVREKGILANSIIKFTAFWRIDSGWLNERFLWVTPVDPLYCPFCCPTYHTKGCTHIHPQKVALNQLVIVNTFSSLSAALKSNDFRASRTGAVNQLVNIKTELCTSLCRPLYIEMGAVFPQFEGIKTSFFHYAQSSRQSVSL